jgi:serine/threonine-protein kinase HipA
VNIGRAFSVVVNDEKAGEFSEIISAQSPKTRRYMFIYNRDYIETGVPIGHHYTLRTLPYFSDDFPPFFSNLIIDMKPINGTKHVKPKTQMKRLELLIASGEANSGAISFKPKSYEKIVAKEKPMPVSRFLRKKRKHIDPEPSRLRCMKLLIDSAPSEIECNHKSMERNANLSNCYRTSFAKIENRKLVLTHERSPYMIKTAKRLAPQFADNVSFFMTLAQQLGIAAPDCGLINFETGEVAFVTFCQSNHPSNRKLLVESGASLCEIQPNIKHLTDLSYESIIKKLTGCAAGNRAVTLNLFLVVLYSYIIGNNNLRLEHFYLQRSSYQRDGIMDRVAYFRTLSSAFPYPNFDKAGTLFYNLLANEERSASDRRRVLSPHSNYGRDDFMQLGLNVGLPKAVVSKQIDELNTKIANVFKYGIHFWPPMRINRFINKGVRERCKLLQARI